MNMLEENPEKKKPNWFSRFGIWCSGASTEALYQCPTEWNKFTINGCIILMTAVLSFVSGSYFLSFVFPEQSWKVPVAFGVIWAFLIFTLDRSIIVSIKKTDVFWQEFKQGSIRIVLAIFIGLVIATPIELRLFQKEIQGNVTKTLGDEKINELTKNRASYDNLIAKMNKEIIDMNKKDSILRVERDVKYKAYIGEAEGTSGTGKVGKGPVFKEKKDAYDKAYTDWEKNDEELFKKTAEKDSINIKIIEVENQIAQIRNDINNNNVQEQEKEFGVEEQVKELYKLSGLHWFVTFLFILIECLPVITKLMNKRGPYDETLERLEYEKLIEQKEIISRKNSEINELLKQADEAAKLNVEIKSKIEKAKADAMLRTNETILDNLAKKQEELALMALDKWFEAEKAKVEASYIKTKPVLENIRWQASKLKDEVYYFFNVSGELEYKKNGISESGAWEWVVPNKEIEIEIEIELLRIKETYVLKHFTTNSVDLEKNGNVIQLKRV